MAFLQLPGVILHPVGDAVEDPAQGGQFVGPLTVDAIAEITRGDGLDPAVERSQPAAQEAV